MFLDLNITNKTSVKTALISEIDLRMMQQASPRAPEPSSQQRLIDKIEAELRNAIDGNHEKISKGDAETIRKSFRANLKKGQAPSEALSMAKAEVLDGDDGLSRYHQRDYRGQRGKNRGGHGHGGS